MADCCPVVFVWPPVCPAPTCTNPLDCSSAFPCLNAGTSSSTLLIASLSLSAFTLPIAKVGMSDDEFFGKLYRSPLLASSKGTPDESVHISSAAEYQDESYDSGGAGGPSFSDMWFSEQENSAGYESRKVNVTYHPTYHPDPQTIRAVPQQRGEHTKIFSKEDFNREASLKPIRMKSDIRRVEETQGPRKNDSQRHLKWLIPLMIVLMVLALALSIIAVILSRSGGSIKSQLPSINKLVQQSDLPDGGKVYQEDSVIRFYEEWTHT